MITAFIGTKKTQTRRYDDKGMRFPVTVIAANPCSMVQVKTVAKDGYNAIQLACGTKKNPTKPMMGHIKKAGLTKSPRFLREILGTADDAAAKKAGGTLAVSDVFAVGDMVAVTGVSKGKGYAGVVKRHHFKGGPHTHGQSDRERAPGAIGSTTTPGRVYKGKRMAGRMGNDTVTVRGLKVIEINAEKNELIVAGLVPGPKTGLLTIAKQNV